MNFCPGELILKLLARIGEWHQNLSEKTAYLREEAIFNVNPRFAFKSMPAIGFLSFYFVANGHFESI